MRKAIVCLLFTFFVCAFISLAGAEQSINNCPLPDNWKVVEPDRNEVPPKLAALSGVWEGNWGPMSVLFIVEKIGKTEAVVLHSVSGRQMARAASIPPNFFRKTCTVEKGGDGNYRIVMTLSQGTNRLIQTNDPKAIRVMREGYYGLSTETRDSLFRRREMK